MKKGFTIVELLASIAIMILIIIISVPVYEGINKTIKEQNLNSKISMIEQATKSYVNKYHKDEVDISNSNKYICYEIKFLITKNVISADNKTENRMTNPLTGTNLNGLIVVNYDFDNFDINVKYEESFDTTKCIKTNNV